MVTMSVIKADTGGFVGHSPVHPRMIEVASKMVDAQRGQLLRDGQVNSCGDDLALIMVHDHGIDADEIHGFACAGVHSTARTSFVGPSALLVGAELGRSGSRAGAEATMVTIDDAGVRCDVDVFERVTNQLFGCGLTLAAVLSHPDLDDEIAKRLRDVVEEFDATLVVVRGAAFDRHRMDQPVRS
jgi:hypothetical protein